MISGIKINHLSSFPIDQLGLASAPAGSEFKQENSQLKTSSLGAGSARVFEYSFD